jgi:PBSX family phage terminase large subunit
MWKTPPPDSKAAEVWIESLDDEDNKIFLLSGAVQSSKTVGSLICWADRVSSGPKNAPRMMLGNTERTLRRNCIYPLQEFVGAKNCRLNSGTGELFLFGRRIWLTGANNIGALSKVQGSVLLDGYADEIATYPIDVVKMLISRLSLPGAKMWGTCNPGPPAHPLKKMIIDRADEISARVWNFELDDNPFLDDVYKNWIKSCYTGVWYKRMVKGLWATADGAVFGNFDPDKHVIKALPDMPMDQMRIGVDRGAANPTAFIKLERYGTVWIASDEYYHQNKESDIKVNSQYAAQLIKFIGPLHHNSIEVDPSALDFIHELSRAGLSRVHSANNDVLNGIQKIAQALQTGNLLIHERCVHLIEEMQSYSWDPKAQILGLDKPIKADDHVIDPLRYVYNSF